MQIPPVTLDDLSFLLVLISIILLMTIQLILPYVNQGDLVIGKKMKKIGIAAGILFIFSVVVKLIFFATG